MWKTAHRVQNRDASNIGARGGINDSHVQAKHTHYVRDVVAAACSQRAAVESGGRDELGKVH